MKTLKFKRDSWHYWLASKVGPLSEWKVNTDFCSYVRAVICGAFFTSILALLAVGATICVGDWLGWLAASIMVGHFIWFDPNLVSGALIVNVALAIVAICFVCFGVVYLWMFAKQKREYHKQALAAKLGDDYVEPPPSFIKHAYLTWKDKTCFKIEMN